MFDGVQLTLQQKVGQMQEYSSRLKTEGTFLKSGFEVNIEKYGEQLKNQLVEISRTQAKRQNMKKEENLKTDYKKSTADSENSGLRQKTMTNQLEESMTIRSKNRQRDIRRNFIYQAEADRQQQKEPKPKNQSPSKSPEKQAVKSRYSDTMSTATSHSKQKEKRFEANMFIDDFSLGKKLGEGKFGEVFVAQHKKSGFVCALKKINRSRLDEKLTVQLCRQIKIQAYLNHPNIVKLYSFFSDEKSVYLVQELCYSGQLYSLLKKKRKMSESLTKIIIQQICRALDYMHECEIIHRDLKPENIIYHSGMVKICDFGWSISSKALRQTFCGTPLYVSPELISRKCYNNKIDVWSVGILAYQLLFGRVPFEIVTEKDFLKILEDQIKFSKATPVSEEAKDFVRCCLSKDPRDRYTVPELLEHGFIGLVENTTLAELY